MKRVRFEKSTEDGKYRKGECVSFDDAISEKLIKAKIAAQIDGPISVGDDLSPAKEMRRIKFITPVSDSGKLMFSAGEIRVLAKNVADRFIENGKAEAMDIPSVGDSEAEPTRGNRKTVSV